MDPNAGRWNGRGVWAAATFLVLALAASPAASGATYTDSEGHYSFEYPALWAAQSASGADISVVGPSAGGFSPNIVAQHGPEPEAQSTPAWLLAYTQAAFDSLKGQLNVTEIQAPRTFNAGSGRLAGDYVFERNQSGTVLRQRQVIFVSVRHALGYSLTFTDAATSYGDHEADWVWAVDSFKVTGETAGASGSGESWVGTVVLVAGVLAVVASLIASVLLRRPAKPAAGAGGKAKADPLRLQDAAEGRPGEWLAVVPGREKSPAPRESISGRPRAKPSSELGDAPPMSLGFIPSEPPSGPPLPRAAPFVASKTVRCPRCRRQFASPPVRPATVECPFCGAKGTLR